jgi:[acyl-carrier-protein] S-malonyltransferase
MSEKKITFLFPGQGSQAVGMGRELYEKHDAARAVFDEADWALGFKLSQLIFEGPDDALRMTENTQPAILTMSVAAARVLMAKGVRPAMAAGHSLGEYSAHVVAGTLTFADAVRTVKKRGRFMQEAVPVGQGAMAAVLGMPAAQVEKICAVIAEETGEVVSAANLNSPEQVVISGGATGVERAAAQAKEQGAKRAVMLPVSAPFHCALMQPAQERLAEELGNVEFSDPDIAVVCNVDAVVVKTAGDARDALTRQVTGAVRWVDCIEKLREMGATNYVEVGPGKVLSGLLRQIDRGLSAHSANVEDEASLAKALASLSS